MLFIGRRCNEAFKARRKSWGREQGNGQGIVKEAGKREGESEEKKVERN